MTVVFALALFGGTAAIALWLAVRLPLGSVRTPTIPLVTAVVATPLLTIAPVRTDTYFAIYGSVFGELVPLLVIVWLSAIWLLMFVRDTVATR